MHAFGSETLPAMASKASSSVCLRLEAVAVAEPAGMLRSIRHATRRPAGAVPTRKA